MFSASNEGKHTDSEFQGRSTQDTVSHVRLDFADVGVVPLHTHPRADETVFVFKGTVLHASMMKQGGFPIFPRRADVALPSQRERRHVQNTLPLQNTRAPGHCQPDICAPHLERRHRD
jgi:hypothetical protein